MSVAYAIKESNDSLYERMTNFLQNMENSLMQAINTKLENIEKSVKSLDHRITNLEEMFDSSIINPETHGVVALKVTFDQVKQVYLKVEFFEEKLLSSGGELKLLHDKIK